MPLQYVTSARPDIPISQNWQGAQILSDDLYLAYFEDTKDAAQQRIWTFYEAINVTI